MSLFVCRHGRFNEAGERSPNLSSPFNVDVPEEDLLPHPVLRRIEIVLGRAWRRPNGVWDTQREDCCVQGLKTTPERTTFFTISTRDGMPAHYFEIDGDIMIAGPW